MSDLQPGRELDALVAEKVMGAVWFGPMLTGVDWAGYKSNVNLLLRKEDGDYPTSYLPYYSTDIAAAWEVVEALQSKGLTVTISKSAHMYTWDVRGWNERTNDNRFIAHAETAPHAICLAALQTVEKK